MRKFFTLIMCCFIIGACTNNSIYTDFRSLKNTKWDKDSICVFEVLITDTLTPRNIYIDIRNNNNYPYKNLWLFSDIQTPSGQIRRDTLNCELANEFGKWHGQGISTYELQIRYESSFIFRQSGIYSFSIRHGMRDEQLNGISEIGIKIE